MHVDILAIGAHRDDIELTCAGTVIKMVRRGYTAAILDLTKGEKGTRGTVAERTREAKAAARIMGVARRRALDLKDAFIENTPATKKKVAAVIREYRPSVILAPYWEANHPDHAVTGRLVRDAAYVAGLKKLKTGKPWYRTPRILYYLFQPAVAPTFFVDVSREFKTRMEAVRAYGSQFYNPGYSGEPTYISRKEFLGDIRARARYYGSLIGVTYAEPFYMPEPLHLPDIMAMVKDQSKVR